MRKLHPFQLSGANRLESGECESRRAMPRQLAWVPWIRSVKALVMLCGLVALFALPATAQDNPPADQNNPPTDQNAPPADQNAPPADQTKPAPAPAPPVKAKRVYITPKVELSAGYNFRTYYPIINSNAGSTLDMNGFYVSGDYNYKRWLAFEGEVTEGGNNQGNILGYLRIWTFLAGAKFTPLGHRKLTPWGHFLAGEGVYDNSTPTVGDFHGPSVIYNTYVYEVGGGVDLNLSKHWGVRLIEADFGSANFVPNTANYSNRGTHRISFGVTYRFGEK
jgi:hypothetical protein